MKKSLKKLLIFILGIFLLIQFYQPARDNTLQVDEIDFEQVFDVPDSIKSILVISCYDCHSNKTKYPWYSNIQPGRFIMDNHIKKGKEDLNYSEYGEYSKRQQENKLSSMIKQIEKNEMPLKSYTILHANAALNRTKKMEVINWLQLQKESLSNAK